MLSEQIEYYNSLTDKKKWIVHMAALTTVNVDIRSIQQHVLPISGITQALISETLGECRNNQIIYREEKYSNDKFDLSFLVWLMPLLDRYKKEWESIIKNVGFSFYSSDYAAKVFRNYLFSLFYVPDNISKYEHDMFTYATHLFPFLLGILDREQYKRVIPLIHKTILESTIDSKINSNMISLLPVAQQTENCANYGSASFIREQMLGNFTGAAGYLTDGENNPDTSYLEAIAATCNGHYKGALALFEKGLKKQRFHVRTLALPTDSLTAFYYIFTLLNQDPKVYSPVFTKIITTLEKKQYTACDNYFLAICTYTLRSKESVDKFRSQFKIELLDQNQPFFGLLSLLVLYYTGEKLSVTERESAYMIARKAYNNGYYLLALEVAYAVSMSENDERSQNLYAEIRDNLGFEAMLSRISKQEDWEKSLNLLVGVLGGNVKASGKQQPKSENRIVYELSTKYMTVQPILQKWQAKSGTWTSGRNIAMKTFYSSKIDGMTEQDYRIAKCIKKYSGGYYYGSEDYMFDETVFKELVGHPHLFLAGGQNIPIELVAGEPAVQISKTGKNYKISHSINDLHKAVIVQKETNTRYKVFALTEKQRTVLNLIKEECIVIPEKGKGKLSEILTLFTNQFTVQSDLIQSESLAVKTIKADSRIRIQLLPYGDGLKAELFAKPFGTHPPYCKPGLGGKILIHNQEGKQLQVSRDLTKESENANILLNAIQSLENIDTVDGLITFEDPKDALFLLNVVEKYQDIVVIEWPEGERFKIRKSIDFSNLKLSLKGVKTWFELQGEVQVDEKTVLTIQQLLEMAAQSKNRFVELKQGEFIALSAQLKKRLNELNSLAKMGKNGVQINKFASVAMDDMLSEFDHLKTDKAWKEFRERLAQAQNKTFDIPAGLQTELRPYQQEGFRWLARLAEWEAGACLADDMGLGKTIQALAVLLHRAALGSALVVAPVSVVPNWMSEIRKFAPSLNIKTLTNGTRKETVDSLEAGDVLITSYGLLQSESDLLSQTVFATLILDEGHTIKNYTTKTSKAAMTLQASFRMALTGTPIQNHLGEIWNLFHFINPGLLGALPEFNDKFVKPEGDSAKKHLRNLIAPFVLRRTKTAVLEELPPKTEIIKKIQLSAEETAFYEAIRRQAILSLENDDSNAGARHIKALAEITRLRQASCNAALVKQDVQIPSTKLSVFMEIVSELKENNHRALVFSQFVTHLTLVRKELDAQNIAYQYLDGSTPLAEREKRVKQFQTGETALFLISLKAGGLGLNLTAADFVIHLDPWWNPAIEDQASDRAHRIGQSRPVTVYRLVAENTIEEKIIELHNTKRDMADTLLEGSDQAGKLTAKELLELIKSA